MTITGFPHHLPRSLCEHPNSFPPPKKSFTTGSFISTQFLLKKKGPIVTKLFRVPRGMFPTVAVVDFHRKKGMRKWTRRRTFHREGWTASGNH